MISAAKLHCPVVKFIIKDGSELQADLTPLQHRIKRRKIFFSEILPENFAKNPVSISRNEHWENYWSLCYPCDIDYDYVLK